MAIKIRTGQPRNGKTQRVIKEIFDLHEANDKLEKEGKPRRKIYTDISGINDPDTPTKLLDCITTLTKEEKETIWFGEHDDPEKPENLWCPDYGSVFIFDECHKLDFVKDTSGALSKNPSTISLNEHGHAGHDIYLITQFPQYIHTHIRGLVETHWHVKRKMGMRWARVYKWDEFQLNPRADKNMADAYEVENFYFKKKYEKAYKSASAHAPVKITFPAKLWLPIIALVVIAYVVWYTGKDSILVQGNQDTTETQQQLEQVQAQNQAQLEQINAMRFELEELKQQYLPKHIAELAEYEDVRPAMVISSSNAPCRVYNSYGEPLIIADGLCRMMDEYPAMIPRTRHVKEISSSLDMSSSQQNNADVKYFDTSQYSQKPIS